MIRFLREYFRFDTTWPVQGWFSWQHITYVTLMLALAVFLGIYLGKKKKDTTLEEKIKVLRIAGFVMVGCELFKIFIICIRCHDPLNFLSALPLFLCSVQLFTIPIASFSKGRLQEASLDFIFIYGMVCAIAGTYLAGNIFGGSPVLSFDPMVSVTTHCISGFACIYVASAKLVSVKKENLWISASLLIGVEILAYIADVLLEKTDYESNYMFLMSSAGTPFEIVNTIVGGVQILYTLFVAFLYLLVFILWVGVTHVIRRVKKKKAVN